MRRSIVLLSSLSVALAALCLYLAYSVIDQSVSLDYARAARRSAEEERAILRKLTLDLAKGAKRDEVKALLSAKYAQGHIVKEEDKDTIFVDGVGLRFRGDELAEIVFMSEPLGEQRPSPAR